MDVELLLDTLTCCLKRLRKDDTAATAALLQLVADRAAGAKAQAEKGSRMEFLLASIAELRTSKKKAGETATALEPLTKAIGSVLKVTKAERGDPIRVRLQDLLAAESRGRWWLVGAAWAGRADGEEGARKDGGVRGGAEEEGEQESTAASGGRSDVRLQELAAEQRMNT